MKTLSVVPKDSGNYHLKMYGKYQKKTKKIIIYYWEGTAGISNLHKQDSCGHEFPTGMERDPITNDKINGSEINGLDCTS